MAFALHLQPGSPEHIAAAPSHFLSMLMVWGLASIDLKAPRRSGGDLIITKSPVFPENRSHPGCGTLTW